MATKRVGLLIFPGFSEFEVTVALSLVPSTHEVVTLALDESPVRSEAGLLCQPHHKLSDLGPADLKVLIIPGGDMVHLKDAEPLFAFVRELHKRERLLAAICSGPYVLARAGVLADRLYTVTHSKEVCDFLGCYDEAAFRYENVVTAGNVITAQGHAFVPFGLAVGKYLDPKLSADVYNFYEGRSNALMEAPPGSA